MWQYLKWVVLTMVFILHRTSGCCTSNSTALIPFKADDHFFGMPVYYRSNMPIKRFYSQAQLENRIHQILTPLSPFILGSETRSAMRRSASVHMDQMQTIVELYEYKYPHITAAQIGDYSFT